MIEVVSTMDHEDFRRVLKVTEEAEAVAAKAGDDKTAWALYLLNDSIRYAMAVDYRRQRNLKD